MEKIELDGIAGLISLRQFSTFFRCPLLAMLEAVVAKKADFVAKCPAILLFLLLLVFTLAIVVTLGLEELVIDTVFSLQSLFITLLADGRLKMQLLKEDVLFPRRCIIEGENVEIDEDWIFDDSRGTTWELGLTGAFCIDRKDDLGISFFICTFNGIAIG